MTQQADPRLPLVDTAGDTDTTASGTDTSPAQPAGWPPTPPEGSVAPLSPPVGFGPMPQDPTLQGPTLQGAQAPVNTLAWVSVVVAFLVSPVAIVLGILARRQIARTGERGRGLATLGAVLGVVFTVIGIAATVLVLVLATQFTAAGAAAGSGPAVDPGAPAPAAQVPATVPGADDPTGGRAQLMAGFVAVGSAAETMSGDLRTHHDDLAAMQGDFSAYRDAIARFRTTATTVTLAPDVRRHVDADLVPATDRVLADLDTLSTTPDQSRLTDAADRLETDSQAMVTAATAAVG
jgi:hypothetical protein